MDERQAGSQFVGYARVSTLEQTLDLQRDVLTVAGCGCIFTDTSSGAKVERVGFAEALSFLRAGDTSSSGGWTGSAGRSPT